MEIIAIPTEQTTAATDALLGLLCLAGIIWLRRFKPANPRRTRLWSWLLGLLAAASFLGTAVHGLVLPQSLQRFLWQPLYLCLGLTVGLFVVAVVQDRFSTESARRVLPWMLAVGCIFFIITYIDPDSFLIFIIYEALAMLFALIMYGAMTVKRTLPGAGFMTAGILLSIAAAAIQAGESLHLTLIWQFDYNGLFHIVQMAGVIVLLEGIRRSMPTP